MVTFPFMRMGCMMLGILLCSGLSFAGVASAARNAQEVAEPGPSADKPAADSKSATGDYSNEPIVLEYRHHSLR